MASGQTYEGMLDWDSTRECWILSVTDNSGRSPVRIQPRGVFDLEALASQLRLFKLSFMRIEFTGYTCEVFRSPMKGPTFTEGVRFSVVLRTLYGQHKHRPINWRRSANRA